MPYIPTMPKNRFSSAVGVALLFPLAAWAQTPSAAPPPAPAGSVEAAQAAAAAAKPEPPTEAELELDAAIKKLAALTSVSADVTQDVDMLDQKFKVSGRYLHAPDHRLYLRLDVSGLADATGTMLQVCDGQTLWDYQKILDSQGYRKLDVGQVFERLKSPELDDATRQKVLASLGFGGPDELLAGLRATIKFTQKDEGTFDGKNVWILTGEWKSRDGLLGPNQQPLPLTVALPAYVPSLVKITLGKDNGWPYKVRLVGRKPMELMDTRRVGQNGERLGGKSTIQQVKPTSIELVYSNVKLNPELRADDFVFQAPQGAKVEDGTQGIVGMLDQTIQLRAAQKKAEAAKGDDPLLKESIDIPRPGAAPPALPTPAGAPK